jgi:hypothetical protein
MSVTENQLNYIKILSSYDYSHEEDKQDIIDFLKQNVKDELSKLSKNEASDLIQLLLERPTGHLLPCDTVIVLDKREVNSFHILGDTGACNHYCPYKKYVGDCEDYENYQNSIDESEIDAFDENKLTDFSDKKLIVIGEKEDEISNLSNRERFEIMVDDFVKSGLRTLSISSEEFSTELSKHYFHYWVKQKYDINEFDIDIEENHCYIRKK